MYKCLVCLLWDLNGAQGALWGLEIKPRLATFKTNSLHTILSFQTQKCLFEFQDALQDFFCSTFRPVIPLSISYLLLQLWQKKILCL